MAPVQWMMRHHGRIGPLFMILTLFLTCPPVFAAFEDRGPDATASGMGITLVADAEGLSARAHNPAVGAWRSRWGLQTSWSNLFGIAELSSFRVDAAGPLGHGFALGTWFYGFGGSSYEERTAGISLSWSWQRILSCGMSVNRSEVELDRYGSDKLYSLDMGLIYRHRIFDAGFSLQNLLSEQLNRFGNTRAPERAVMGTVLPLDPGMRLIAEYTWERNHTPHLSAGVEFRLYGRLRLRSGWDGSTQRIAIGIGVTTGDWTGSGAVDHHPALGWSRCAGLTWDPDEKTLP